MCCTALQVSLSTNRRFLVCDCARARWDGLGVLAYLGSRGRPHAVRGRRQQGGGSLQHLHLGHWGPSRHTPRGSTGYYMVWSSWPFVVRVGSVSPGRPQHLSFWRPAALARFISTARGQYFKTLGGMLVPRVTITGRSAEPGASSGPTVPRGCLGQRQGG